MCLCICVCLYHHYVLLCNYYVIWAAQTSWEREDATNSKESILQWRRSYLVDSGRAYWRSLLSGYFYIYLHFYKQNLYVKKKFNISILGVFYLFYLSNVFCLVTKWWSYIQMWCLPTTMPMWKLVINLISFFQHWCGFCILVIELQQEFC